MRKEKRKQPHPQTQTIPNNATQKCPKSSFLVSLVTELSELSLGLLVDLGALLGIGKVSSGSLLAGVVCGTLNLSSLLKSVNITNQYISCAQIPALQPYSIKYTNLATTSWYFQPTSWESLPTVQYLRPGFNLKTRRACGTTMRLTLSYGGGTPSKTLSLSMAAAPRAVLCGIIPRTVL